MTRHVIITLYLASLPVSAAVEQTPLQGSITSIIEMQEKGKLVDARRACEAALATAPNPSTAAQERGMLLTTCGIISRQSGDLVKSLNLLESAQSLWRTMFGPTAIQVGATSLDLAVLHRLAGRYELSEQYARTALDIYESGYGKNSLMVNNALITLSAAEILNGRYADAESNLKRVLALLKAASLESRDAAVVYYRLGQLYHRQGRYREAERSHLRAAALQGSGPDSARNLVALARVYHATGRCSKAEAACSRALDLLTGFLGPDHAEVVATLQIFAQVRQSQKRYAEAADLLNRALDSAVRSPVRDPGLESTIRSNMGVSYFQEKRYGEAESQFRKALLIYESLGNDSRITLAAILHNLGLVCDKQGRRVEALDLASRAFALREADVPNADSNLVEIMLHKAELLRKAHRTGEAAKLEQVARQAKAERSDGDQSRWMVDFRDLQNKR
jgi:tetratricopeptide (TPR) repeat protein